MKQILNGIWRLRGYYPHVPLFTTEKRYSRHYATRVIDAQVPGGIHMDLFRAGLIQNPYVDDNSLACEWTEHRWWVYETEIELLRCESKKKELVFEGLDYLAEIYLNEVSVGEHENMFTPMRIDISDIKTEKLKITVVLKGAVAENGQQGRTSESKNQKSRFGYKWDFGTRLVNIGIWKDVYVEYIKDARLTEAKIYTDTDGEYGVIDTAFAFEGDYDGNVVLALNAPNGEAVYENSIPFSALIGDKIKLSNPLLWYPNRMGEQPLYTLTLTVSEEKYEYKVGIRRLRYVMNPGSPADALPYTLEINGKPVYIRGNNKVPLDHLYSNVSREDYEWCVRAMANENVNLVRVWGGGIIETELFYDLCDKYGIMVWQDFMQSSTGLDHIPSKDEGFLAKLAAASAEATKTKRNHVSLVIYTGGNELTDETVHPSAYSDKNIAMLKDIVAENDPARIFYPTTPSGPVYGTDFSREDNHDVHSPWEYFPVDHYENYNRLKLLLHSEFGISAMSDSIPLFMSKNEPDPEHYNTNFHHGEYWWHSYRRDKKIYGEFENISDYIPYSQWTQAEGLRYTIETERRMSPYASGSMVWQINEPWPNCDCTNLMDYFGNPKMAYYWVKKSFSVSQVTLKYSNVMVKGALDATIYLDGDAQPCDEKCTAVIYDSLGNQLYSVEYKLSELPKHLDLDLGGYDGIVRVRLTHRGIDKDYFFSTAESVQYGAAQRFEKCELALTVGEMTSENELSYVDLEVKNTGKYPAYFVKVADKNMGYAILCDDLYFTLMPGESRKIKATMKKRCGLFFGDVDTLPEIIVSAINI